MADDLLAAYRATAYRVRLANGGWAALRIDRAVPAALASLLADQPWGFITAWNPHSRKLALHDNRVAQRQLLRQLRLLGGITRIRAGVGVGLGWREPSLLVVGIHVTELDMLAREFQQNAYVHGHGDGVTMLRWM
ncbi:DUF3293 domain-containing protein [Dyella sp.]|uniref:DUF3293 domain-containing protein n=1 Tax=Dyella sp. TaxID=1869338 RepID=UPI002ECFF52C